MSQGSFGTAVERVTTVTNGLGGDVTSTQTSENGDAPRGTGGRVALPSDPGHTLRLVSPTIYDVDRDGAVVRVSGEVDYAAKEALQEALTQAAASSTDVVVDMRGTTFVDSTAISVLISSRHAADARRGTLTLLPSTPVRRVLSILGLGEFLGVTDVD